MDEKIFVKLEDNKLYEVPLYFREISQKFIINDNVIMLDTSKHIFDIINEFSQLYFSNKSIRKILDDHKQLWQSNYKNTVLKILNKSEPLSENIIVMLELIKLTSDLDIKSLFNICCYYMSDILNNHSVDEIQKIIGKNDIDPEIQNSISDITEWLHD